MQLNTTFTLPCGVVLKNRIGKSAMSENLCGPGHAPSPEIIRLYERWGLGGPGLVITGNITIDRRALGEPANIVVENKKDFKELQSWAKSGQPHCVLLWGQINHPGRQAMGMINKEVVAPSAVKLKVKGGGMLFKKPRALQEEEILELIERYGNTARILKEAGFKGVQIHGAHGYLISQFLSPLTNVRTDKWGGSLENRARFVIEVYRNVRKQVGDEFPVGIKINSADFQRGGFTDEESMEVVKLLSAEKIDLIEISGGTYEKASMMGVAQKQSTLEREAYFLDYIEKVRTLTSTPLMLTGGFRTVSVMEDAIAQGKLDVVGLARPFTLYPDLPHELFNHERDTFPAQAPKTGLKMIDKMGFFDLYWYEKQIHRLGQGVAPKPEMGLTPALGHFFGQLIRRRK